MSERVEVPLHHFVNGHLLAGPYPEGSERAVFAMGCFWGAERLFWEAPGVWVTAAGYCGGKAPHPSYEQVCSGLTGHAESVLVVFEPNETSYENLLELFWENHDPTQGMRQGNDVGTQYRSGIFWTSQKQHEAAEASRDAYAEQLGKVGFPRVTTEVAPAGEFWFAEDYHQQYLAKNPRGYCGLAGTGVKLAVPFDIDLGSPTETLTGRLTDVLTETPSEVKSNS
jgi:peptide-methionine (S)-S-oxide reductase